MLRDYRCPHCNQITELFDDDDKICPQCEKGGLVSIISAPNIKTSSKSRGPAQFGQPAGMSYEVKDGQVINSRPIVVGEMIDIPAGEKRVLALQPNPNPQRIAALAQAMEAKSPAKDKSKLH